MYTKLGGDRVVGKIDQAPRHEADLDDGSSRSMNS
jgi:hypothetical protein